MSDFYSAIVFLSAFIMIIMVLLVRSNDLVEYSEKQTIYTISVLVIAGAVTLGTIITRFLPARCRNGSPCGWTEQTLRCGSCM